MSGTVNIGIMGKHPGYGDFLRWGLSEPTVDHVMRWTDAVLPPLRDQMGEAWGVFWDEAQTLRFWIGRAVLGKTLIGVLKPSRDRVGRRFPLIMLCEGAAIAAPLSDWDQRPWEDIEHHMNTMEAGQGAKALLAGASFEIEGEDAAVASGGPTLWAHHPEGKLDALLRKAAEVDIVRAQLSRSYWWAPGSATHAPVWLGCQGLPDAQSLGWLLGGVVAEAAS